MRQDLENYFPQLNRTSSPLITFESSLFPISFPAKIKRQIGKRYEVWVCGGGGGGGGGGVGGMGEVVGEGWGGEVGKRQVSKGKRKAKIF